ncbi:MAG: hypothetical protein QF541_06015 [Lentisphaeria bacterium]|jgi:hypothetical protein|nr:hypothetical protein [Lentisphaeria bacterium]
MPLTYLGVTAVQGREFIRDQASPAQAVCTAHVVIREIIDLNRAGRQDNR